MWMLNNVLVNTWVGFPVFIKITFIVAFVSFFGAFVSIFFLYLSKLRAQIRKTADAELSKEIQELLLKHIIIPLSDSKDNNDIEPDIYHFEKILSKSKHSRKVFVTELINFRNAFSGNISDQLRKLYIKLGLHQAALNKLSSKKWRIVSAGLVELFRMEVNLNRKLLLQLTQHPNRYIKEIARWYIIKQTDENPLYTLEEIHEPILPWEELEILKLFTDKKGFLMPSVKHLLEHSTEPSVLGLGIKLAAYFKQEETVPVIIQLLYHENYHVKREAIQALGIMTVEEAEPKLVYMYHEQPDFIKTAILNTLGQIGSGNHIGFLQHELLRSDEFEIKRSASQALVSQARYAKGIIDTLLMTSAEQVRKLLKYYLNPLTRRNG